MWPWGHLAVGYLGYSLYVRFRTEHGPRESSVLALVVGTQFPDVIDKPLAWTFGILPSGHSLAHSLLTATVVLGILYRLAGQPRHRSLLTGFTIGYLTHIGADALEAVVLDDSESLIFLVWPLVPIDGRSARLSVLAPFQSIRITPFVVCEIGLVGFTVGLWFYDGTPGLGAVRRVSVAAYRNVKSRW